MEIAERREAYSPILRPVERIDNPPGMAFQETWPVAARFGATDPEIHLDEVE